MQLAATRAGGGDSSPVIELYERARCHDMIARTREAHDVLEDYLLPCMRLLHLRNPRCVAFAFVTTDPMTMRNAFAFLLRIVDVNLVIVNRTISNPL